MLVWGEREREILRQKAACMRAQKQWRNGRKSLTLPFEVGHTVKMKVSRD